VGAGNVHQSDAAAVVAAAPLRCELEDGESALAPAGDDLEDQPGVALATVDVDSFGHRLAAAP
jgi:hypothetical protein